MEAPAESGTCRRSRTRRPCYSQRCSDTSDCFPFCAPGCWRGSAHPGTMGSWSTPFQSFTAGLARRGRVPRRAIAYAASFGACTGASCAQSGDDGAASDIGACREGASDGVETCLWSCDGELVPDSTLVLFRFGAGFHCQEFVGVQMLEASDTLGQPGGRGRGCLSATPTASWATPRQPPDSRVSTRSLRVPRTRVTALVTSLCGIDARMMRSTS